MQSCQIVCNKCHAAYISKYAHAVVKRDEIVVYASNTVCQVSCILSGQLYRHCSVAGVVASDTTSLIDELSRPESLSYVHHSLIIQISRIPLYLSADVVCLLAATCLLRWFMGMIPLQYAILSAAVSQILVMCITCSKPRLGQAS